MHGMLEQVEKGEFDDYEDLYPDGGLIPPTQGVKRSRSQSVPRTGPVLKKEGAKKESRPTERAQKTSSRTGGISEPKDAPKSVGEARRAPGAPRAARVRSRSPVAGSRTTSSPPGLGLDVSRMLRDPTYAPSSSIH